MNRIVALRRGWRILGLALVLACLCGCPGEEAKKRAQEAADEAARQSKEALAAAEKLRAEWQPKLVDAATEAKAEFDKVVPSKTEYELILTTPEEGAEKLKAHEARLAKMDRIEVKGLMVGYEQCQECSVNGKSFERHFRATWMMEQKVIGISYYSKKAIDIAAFVDLLKRLVPITSEAFRHVQIKRGE